jgi:hypothetical protein
MQIVPIFSPFYFVQSLNEKEYLSNKYIPLIEENYRSSPNNAWDWNVHTSYGNEDNLPNRVDWNELLGIYHPYIQNFLRGYFNQDVSYKVSGAPWYTVYGKGQNANTHEHLPDHFAVVHFIKFNPEVHWPISFVNPNGHSTKYFLELNPHVKNKINFNNSLQSYFHPRFTPSLQEGDLVIFPGQLEHLVEKNHSDEIRITIAFNINIV